MATVSIRRVIQLHKEHGDDVEKSVIEEINEKIREFGGNVEVSVDVTPDGETFTFNVVD